MYYVSTRWIYTAATYLISGFARRESAPGISGIFTAKKHRGNTVHDLTLAFAHFNFLKALAHHELTLHCFSIPWLGLLTEQLDVWGVCIIL